MYHISDDIRAQRSARRICAALMECAKYKPFSEITVSDLKKEYGITRTTFYRMFDNTVDVLEYLTEQMGKTILLSINDSAPEATPKELAVKAITVFSQQKELLELLSQSGHMDILQRVQEKYLPQSRLAEGLDFGVSVGYFHKIMAQLISASLDVWVNDGQKDTPEEIYEKLYCSIRMLGIWFAMP